MGKHYNGRTKKTYSKYSKPETKENFRMRLKKPCPKFEDLFIDKGIAEDLFTSPPLKEPFGVKTEIYPDLKFDSSSYFLISGNDTFDAVARSELKNAPNFTKLEDSKRPEMLSTSTTTTTTTSLSSNDDAFLSALQSPYNKEFLFSTPSKFDTENKYPVPNRDIARKNNPVKEESYLINSHFKEELLQENKNLTNSICNVITSTPTVNSKECKTTFMCSVVTSTPTVNNIEGRCRKRMEILKNELSPVDKNSSFDIVEDSYISESDIRLLNEYHFKHVNAADIPTNLSVVNKLKNLDLNTEGNRTNVNSDHHDNSSDIVYSEDDIFLSNTFSTILSLKPTTFQRVTRRRKFRGNCSVATNEKFYYSSKISLPNHSRFDKNGTKTLLSRNSNINKKVSCSYLSNKNATPNNSTLSNSICKGGKGWRRSVKKISNIIITQSFKSVISFTDKEDYKVRILQLCEQDQELMITKCFDKSMMEKCKKIGEGLFGEVFLLNVDEKSETEVLKLMPIEGDVTVNGEPQKSFQQMVPEIIISKYLSDLQKQHSRNFCPSFVKMNKCWCLKGAYTQEMLRLWDVYAENKGTENDRPDIFSDEQLHLALQFEFAGQDLEACVFNNGKQAYSIFLQIAYALCVAEIELSFEHRDLHWGNVLIGQTSETFLVFTVKGHSLKLKTYGVKATIIDFTLSRLSVDGRVYYNDLSLDPDLFTAEGDYQFDIYRKMQENNKDDWKAFHPKSNIFWLHYILLKIKDECYYKNKTSKIHKEGLKEMKTTANSILSYESASHLVYDLEDIS